MTTLTNKVVVPYEDPRWVPILPSRWVAEYDGEVAGSIERTTRGRYLATNRHGRKVGTFRSLDQARQRLSESNSATRMQRLDQSRILRFGGLAMLAATIAVAAFGLSTLLGR